MFFFNKKDKIKKMWDERYKSFQSENQIPWNGDRREELNLIFKKYDLVKGKALDLGCGYGDKSFYLAEIGFETIGIDISQLAINEALKRSEDKNNVKFLLMDLNDIGNFNEEFDFVLDLCTSHFLKDGEKKLFVSNLCKILKPNGLYVYQTYIKDEAGNSPVNIAVSVEAVNDLYSKAFKILESIRVKSKYNEGAFLETFVMRKL